MITATDLGIHFGEKILFANANFQLNKGNRYGLVGANGSGKSTLVRILAGEIVSETGEINIPASLKLGVLKQDQFRFGQEKTVDIVLMGKPLFWKALKEKNELALLPDVTEDIGKRLAELEMIISDQNGYQAEADASELLAGLGIPQKQQKEKLSTLSGGYRLRVLLAQCLFSEPEFLLLDEPTNHLDLPSIIWLEEYLNKFSGTCLIVSHDHYFLDRISTHILDIDYETIKIYQGNYSKFVEYKELENVQKNLEIARQEKKKEDLQNFIDRFKAKASKARQAKSKAKQRDRVEDIIIKRSSHISPDFKFDICRPSGKIAFTTKNLTKSFAGKNVINSISLTVKRGEKIGLIGPNGIGKSTLIKILANKMTPSAGLVEMGYEIHCGYCPQDHMDMIPQGTDPYDWLYSFAPGETVGVIRKLLARVLLQGDDVFKAVESLSGGETTRLILAMIMLAKPNLLLLDEPTNHLDLKSTEALSKALRNYAGTIVCVSHDRWFIEGFATTILELTTSGHEMFSGSYSEYIEKQGQDYLDRTTAQAIKKTSEKTPQSVLENNEWREVKRQIGRLERSIRKREKKISEIENEIESVNQQLSEGSLYQPENKKKLEQILLGKDNLHRDLDTAVKEWEELEIKLDSLSSLLSG